MKKETIFFASLLSLSLNSFAQMYTGQQAESRIQGTEAILYTEQSAKPCYIEFSPTANRGFIGDPRTVIKEVLGLKTNDDLIKIAQEMDAEGYSHTRYQQAYKNIAIEGAVYISHMREGVLNSINGAVADLAEMDITAEITEASALKIALKKVGAQKYKWENQEEVDHLREAHNDPDFNYDPTGKLVIYPVNGNFAKGGDFRLAYKFDIFAEQPLSRSNVYVDAKTGEIIGHVSLIHHGNATGTAYTKYSGTKTIITDQVSATSFRLRETGRGKGIDTYNAWTGTNPSPSDFYDANNTWNNINAAKDEAATDAHWASEMTYDYYLNKHGRNSIDNLGFKLINYVHYDYNWANAFWSGTYMAYGDGNNGRPWTTLDIGAHEMTHGLTSRTAQLVYQNESGALNESFSDIFGTAVVFYARPERANYTFAEDLGFILRSLSNPNAASDPDTYKGSYWHYAASDWGGVHVNSGVQNYWFYLLAVGGSGTNDIGAAYSVSGIGREKAEKIAYRTLTVYLTPNSVYSDARFYSLQAAKDLYGSCSQEYQQTANAWHAVGIGAKATSCTPTIIPTTTITAANWVSQNFTANFTDADGAGGSGIKKSFYHVIDNNGTDWRGNKNNGFIRDNFNNAIHADWTKTAGTWATSAGVLKQSDATLANTIISSGLTQNLSSTYMYHWTGKIEGTGTNKRAGLHFMCSSGTTANRGNSYMVWFRADQSTVEIYKSVNDVLGSPVKTAPVTISAAVYYDYKVIYDRTTGVIDVYVNNVKVTSWTDAAPLQTGSYISFRSGGCVYSVDDVYVYRSRAATATVSVGAAATNDIRYQNVSTTSPSGIIKSIVLNNSGSLSSVASKSINVDWTAAAKVTVVRDGTTTTDISTTTNSTKLSANWPAATDANSGITKYQYAIGKTAGATDVANWTDNGTATAVTRTGLTLTVGQLYYTSVRSVNGAGLVSAVTTSNGQKVVSAAGPGPSASGSTGFESEPLIKVSAYPNPFKDNLTVEYELTENQQVIITLVDVLGKESILYINESQAVGNYNLQLNTSELELSNGIYIVRLKAGGKQYFLRLVHN
ncbi:MAG: M4 family metallopeptidase [Bacteroidota bacterium]